MKKKIKIISPEGKVISGTITIPNKDHLEVQKRYRATIIRPLKGKGSYKRNKKVINEDE